MVSLRVGKGSQKGGLLQSLANASATGAYYDPSDRTSLFSGRSANTGSFKSEPRRNMLTYTEEFENAVWVKFNGATASGTTLTFVNSNSYFQRTIVSSGVVSGQTVTFSMIASVASGSTSLTMALADGADGNPFHNNPIVLTTTPTRFVFTQVMGAGFAGNLAVQLNGSSLITAGSIVTVAEVQVEVGDAATDYQYVGSSYDYEGSSVGIMLDKLQMGGKTAANFIADQPNIFPSDTPTIDDNAGTVGSYSAGVFGNSGSGVASYPRYTWTSAVTIGQLYYVKITTATEKALSSAGGSVIANRVIANATGTSIEGFFVANATTFTLSTSYDTTVVPSFTLIDAVLKHIPGFHAIAPSDAARPLYKIGAKSALMESEPELVTNGGFDSDTAWSKGTYGSPSGPATISGGVATIPNTDPSNGSYIYQAQTTVPGRIYRAVATIGGGASCRIFIGTAPISGQIANINFSSGQIGEVVFVATTTTTYFSFYGAQGGSPTVDNASFKEIPAAKQTHYLQPDGVDDWMNVSPTLNLGETWSHVGGWRTDTDGRRIFATTNLYQGAVRRLATVYDFRDTADTGFAAITTAATLTDKHVLTVEKATTSMTGRINSANQVTGAGVFDTSVQTRGLALFSQQNSSWANGTAGRFYGGYFGATALLTSQRHRLENVFARKAGVTL